MSSPDEMSVWGTGFGPEGGEQACVCPASRALPQGADRGPEPRKPPSGVGRGGCPGPEGFQSEWQMLETGGPVLCGHEGRPGSPADDTKGLMDLAEESAEGILQQLYDRDVLGFRRYPLAEPCVSFEVFAGLEACPSRPGATAQSCGEAPSALAGPLHLGGPEAGRAWREPKRATKRRLNVAADRQRFSAEALARQLSDSESSDEFSDTELMTLGRSKRYTMGPSGTKQAKHTSAGKKSVVTWTRESEAVAGEDKDPSRDPAPKGQLPAHRPGTSYPRMHRGKASSGEVDTRGPQYPGNSEPLALNQGEVMPGGPAPSGDWEPLDHPPRPETLQQPLGMPGCPSCLVLQREVDDLKKKLAAIWCLADKFQNN